MRSIDFLFDNFESGGGLLIDLGRHATRFTMHIQVKYYLPTITIHNPSWLHGATSS